MLPYLRRPSPTMAELDGHLWTAGLAITAYGLTIGIRTDGSADLDLIRPLLPYSWKVRENAAVHHLYSLRHTEGGSCILHANAHPITPQVDLALAIDTLARDIRIFVAEHARNRVFIHAGAVGWNDRAILIPGRSFSGKTTLVAELVRAGATYYSDEFAVLDRHGRVHPFLKPLSLRQSGSHEQSDVPIEALAGTSGSKPLPVGRVVITEYRRGARWQPRTLTPGEGVLALLANAVAVRRRPETVIQVLERTAREATFTQGLRGEAAEMVPKLL